MTVSEWGLQMTPWHSSQPLMGRIAFFGSELVHPAGTPFFVSLLPRPQEQGLTTSLDVGQDLFVARMAAHANGAGYAPLGQSQEEWQQVMFACSRRLRTCTSVLVVGWHRRYRNQ